MRQRTSLKITRAVWAAITANPHASMRDLGRTVKRSNSTVAAAVRQLEDAGYIASERTQSGVGGGRARQVLVPFVAIERE